MADRLVTVYHPLGWPVVVGPARAEVFRARGYTDEVAETSEAEQSKPARRTRATK